ncbi:hypothetical protein LJR296_008237 [Cupriavidus necator]|uniref:hypothetical protein n=1 Tax=Cupriavidus necator TaxID=106590 RepID=UPI003ECF5D38
MTLDVHHPLLPSDAATLLQNLFRLGYKDAGVVYQLTPVEQRKAGLTAQQIRYLMQSHIPGTTTPIVGNYGLHGPHRDHLHFSLSVSLV